MDREDEEKYYAQNPFTFTASSKSSSSKLQERKNLSRARWDEKMCLGEIVEKKGSMWVTTGILRKGKLYCHIEELVFLVERGDLVLHDIDDEVLSLKDGYKKIVDGKYGCSWESFRAYRYLKSFGYVVGRHGILWTLKSGGDMDDNILSSLQYLNLNEMDTVFDVYKPNSNFRKTSPGNPHFVVAVTRIYPPPRYALGAIEGRLPVKICYVGDGRVAFFSVEKASLPILP